MRRIAPVSHFGLDPIAPARFPDYSHSMNNKKLFLKTNKVGFVLGAVLLVALTENAGYAGGVRVGIDWAPVVVVAPPGVVVAPPVVVAPAVVVQDDYVYYPDYGVYYNSGRHQYYYLRGDAWVWAPAPEGISVDVLLASPSVHMDWHDSPANHHKEMIQKYPRDWKPADGHQDMRQDMHQDQKSSDVHQDQKEDRNVTKPDHDQKPPGQ